MSGARDNGLGVRIAFPQWLETSVGLPDLSLRIASARDLFNVSAVIASAVDTWQAPARLKRCVLPVLAYDEVDLTDHEVLLVSESSRPIAMAAWQPEARLVDPHGCISTLLHGLFVAETAQGRGLGRWLQAVVASRAREAGFHGLHVKAERFAVSYFAGCGFQRLGVGVQPEGGGAVYPYWFWKACADIEQGCLTEPGQGPGAAENEPVRNALTGPLGH
jgi:GNAT superfamily N-acetyltransferase